MTFRARIKFILLWKNHVKLKRIARAAEYDLYELVGSHERRIIRVVGDNVYIVVYKAELQANRYCKYTDTATHMDEIQVCKRMFYLSKDLKFCPLTFFFTPLLDRQHFILFVTLAVVWLSTCYTNCAINNLHIFIVKGRQFDHRNINRQGRYRLVIPYD